MTRADDILPTYQRVAASFARDRHQGLFERPALDGLLDLARAAAGDARPHLLDIGCGTGRPLAAHLVAMGADVTGVDGAAAMLDRFRANLPGARAVLADMRGLRLGRRFHGLLAWDSFFHLAPAAQRAMFATFAAHALPGAGLVFTSGPRASEAVGGVDGAPVYHASLSPAEYRRLLHVAGFDVLSFRPEDPALHGHSVWVARLRAIAG